jgi:hypothetical protein
MDVERELQALWDSLATFTIESDGSRFVMKVGEYLPGLGTQATARTLEAAPAWVLDQVRGRRLAENG